MSSVRDGEAAGPPPSPLWCKLSPSAWCGLQMQICIKKKKGQKKNPCHKQEFVSYPIPQLQTKFVLLKKPLQKHYGCCCRLIALNCRSTDHTYEALVLVFVSVPLQVCLKLNCISVNDKCRVYQLCVYFSLHKYVRDGNLMQFFVCFLKKDICCPCFDSRDVPHWAELFQEKGQKLYT